MSSIGFASPGMYDAARSLLRDVGYDDASIKRHLKVESIDEARKLGRTALMARTAGGTALDTLIRVLLCGQDVTQEAMAKAVAPMGVSAWMDAGLVRPGEGGVSALLTVTPLEGRLFVHDPPVRAGVRPPADYVMGAATSSMTLANITVRRRAGLTLDLGTGCGVQAVFAAAHSDRVIATDLNPRATELAGVTARLNGLLNIDTRLGSLFEPVQGEAFDLIVSNPPFVISPSKEFIYRDGGMHGDGISRAVITGAARQLSPGGFACILCNWAHLRGVDWQERLASWAEGSGCDLWVLRSWASDPSEYAARWLTHSENLEGDALRARHREWMEYYQAAGIDAMGSGVVLLHKSGGVNGSNWARFSEAPDKMLGPCGDQVARAIESWRTVIALRSDEALSRARVKAHPDVRIMRETRPATQEEGGEGWALASAKVRVCRGLAYEGTLDPVTMGLLAACEGQAPLGDVVSMVAANLNLDAERLLGPALGVVRKWLELGIVEAVPPAGGAARGLGPDPAGNPSSLML